MRLAIGLLFLSQAQGMLAQVTTVPCGGPPVDETYCYINNDSHNWHWQSSGGEALIMIFSAGTIGPSNAGVLLYDHVGPAEDLAGLQVTGASGDIYMENSSDGSVSCESGGQTQWVWQVGCLDCTPAIATYSILNDCFNSQYFVEVHITVLGSDPTLDISAASFGVLTTATDTGTYTVGPFMTGDDHVGE